MGFLLSSEVPFKPISVVKHNLVWMWVSAYPHVIKQLANPGRRFFYVIIITARNLIEVVSWHFHDIELACGRVDCRHAGQTNIIPNHSATQMILSHRISI